jgi:hypothetical protein
MRPARVHVGQIIAVAAIVVSAIWSASQSAAAPLGSHPALGPAWLAVISFPVFLPWRLFGWGTPMRPRLCLRRPRPPARADSCDFSATRQRSNVHLPNRCSGENSVRLTSLRRHASV